MGPTTVRDGLERALRGNHDLVILDLLLPRLDGLSVLRELRRRSPDLPVVIVSARSDLSTKLRGFNLGANDYLAKPFALDELIARVRAQLRAHGNGHDGVLQAGELILDLARRQARIGDAEIDLSDREFRLLHHLVKHAGEVVTRDSILSVVWGCHFDPRSNVVDVCVRRLRRKLGDDAPIETMRHAGYRITRRLDRLEIAVVRVRALNIGAMLRWPSWETIPFHLIWFTLTLLYGFRVWALRANVRRADRSGIVTGLLIAHDAMNGTQEWGELFEVPLMSAMFLAMVWHARRHRAAALPSRGTWANAPRCSRDRSGSSTTSPTS